MVAAKAAAQRVEAEMREMYGEDHGEYERERMYESAGLEVFLRSRLYAPQRRLRSRGPWAAAVSSRRRWSTQGAWGV